VIVWYRPRSCQSATRPHVGRWLTLSDFPEADVELASADVVVAPGADA
jgi:hypothetical protein